MAKQKDARALDAAARQVSGLPNGGDVEQRVTLSQAAAIVNRSKRTLADLKPEMPAPCVPGGKGKPAEWYWSTLRPWLEERFGGPLPELFPTDRFIRR